MKHLYRTMSFLLLLIWAVNIFSLSSENAEKSTETGDGLTVAIVKIVYPEYNKMTEPQKQSLVSSVRPYIRTAAHFFEYAVLGFLAALFLINFPLKKPWVLLISEVFSIIYALSDEIHQLFSPGRAFQITDIITDTLGAAAGLTIFLLLVHPKQKYSKKKM